MSLAEEKNFLRLPINHEMIDNFVSVSCGSEKIWIWRRILFREFCLRLLEWVSPKMMKKPFTNLLINVFLINSATICRKVKRLRILIMQKICKLLKTIVKSFPREEIFLLSFPFLQLNCAVKSLLIIIFFSWCSTCKR